MAWLKGWILGSFLLTVFNVKAQYEKAASYPSSTFTQFQLKHPASGESGSVEFTHLSDLFLFVFLSPECPLSQQYSVVLNEVANSYPREVKVIGIFPGKSYDRTIITAFLKKYKIAFATYIDENKQLTNYLQASVTPEVILLGNENQTATVKYRGAIDDRVVDLGKKKLKAGSYYLNDAIEACLQKKDVVIKKTTAVGCLINDY